MNVVDLRSPQGSSPSDPTMRDLVAPLFRRKMLVGMVFACSVLLAIFVAIGVSGQHKASMSIWSTGSAWIQW